MDSSPVVQDMPSEVANNHNAQLPDFNIRHARVCEFGKTKWVLDVKVVNDIEFVCLEKWDRHFVQFSTGEALDFRNIEHKSANKRFFDELLAARKAASVEAIKKALEEPTTDEAVESDAKKRKRKAHYSMSTLNASLVLGPPIVDIVVRGYSMRVLCELKSTVLWMELIHANMDFVRKGIQDSDRAGRSWSKKQAGGTCDAAVGPDPDNEQTDNHSM